MNTTFEIICSPWIESGFTFNTLQEAVANVGRARELCESGGTCYGKCKCFDELASISQMDDDNLAALYDIDGTLIEKY